MVEIHSNDHQDDSQKRNQVLLDPPTGHRSWHRRREALFLNDWNLPTRAGSAQCCAPIPLLLPFLDHFAHFESADGSIVTVFIRSRIDRPLPLLGCGDACALGGSFLFFREAT